MSKFTISDHNFLIQIKPVVDYSMRALCAKPYRGHKRGCPKQGKGIPTCPPDAPLFDQYFDMTKPFFAVVNEFDLADHSRKLAVRHPEWTERQLRDCLYWQGTAQKMLERKVQQALDTPDLKGFIATYCPEAMGVNITETMKSAGIDLEWPPIKIVRQIAILGLPIGHSEAP